MTHARVVGRLMCRLGFHRWRFRDEHHPEDGVVWTLAWCARCDHGPTVVDVAQVDRP